MKPDKFCANGTQKLFVLIEHNLKFSWEDLCKNISKLKENNETNVKQIKFLLKLSIEQLSEVHL